MTLDTQWKMREEYTERQISDAIGTDLKEKVLRARLPMDYDVVEDTQIVQTYYDNLAMQIRMITGLFRHTDVGKYITYVLNRTYKECIEEALYIDRPEIVDFICKCGYNDTEVLALNDVYKTIENSTCECGGRLYGQCMIVTCRYCGKEYAVDTIHTRAQCTACAAYKLGSCWAGKEVKRFDRRTKKNGNSKKSTKTSNEV